MHYVVLVITPIMALSDGLCIMCVTQVICSDGSSLAAAITLKALSVPTVVTLYSIFKKQAIAHASAKCISAVFTSSGVQLYRGSAGSY